MDLPQQDSLRRCAEADVRDSPVWLLEDDSIAVDLVTMFGPKGAIRKIVVFLLICYVACFTSLDGM